MSLFSSRQQTGCLLLLLPPLLQGNRRNVNWSSQGKWVHAAKIGFEKYFLHKIRSGTSEPFYEKLAMKALGIDKLKQVRMDD